MLLFIAGPLVWVLAIAVAAFVSHHGDAIGRALLILAVSFTVSVAALIPLRALRVREERTR